MDFWRNLSCSYGLVVGREEIYGVKEVRREKKLILKDYNRQSGDNLDNFEELGFTLAIMMLRREELGGYLERSYNMGKGLAQ